MFGIVFLMKLMGQDFFFLETYFIINSVFLIAMGAFKSFISYWMNSDSLR